jgi:hypothetical protein
MREMIDRGPHWPGLATLADQAETNLKALSKTILDGLKPPSGTYAFFSHNSHCLTRVRDNKRILQRLCEQRVALTVLAHAREKHTPKDWAAGPPPTEELQAVMREESEIGELMKLDFESLYMFGGILLDQWAIQAIAIGNLPLRKKYPYRELVDYLQVNSDALHPVRESLARELLWLYYQMRFYRNRFVVHANRPWQRGTTRSVFGHDFNLFTPTPPGWLNDEELDQEIKGLVHLAPEPIRNAPVDYWEKARPGALTERLFDNIPNIEDPEDRKKIAELIGKKGGSTPSFEIVGRNLLGLVAKGTAILSDLAQKNLRDIDIGKPFMTSEEMHAQHVRDKP